MTDHKGLIELARRAEGSEMLHKISFGRMNAETLILRLADALEAAMTTPDAEEIARLCADLIAVREQVAVAYRAAVNAAFEPTQGKHSGPLLGYLTGATPPPADAIAALEARDERVRADREVLRGGEYLKVGGDFYNLHDLGDAAFELVKQTSTNPGFDLPPWFYSGSPYAEQIRALGVPPCAAPASFVPEYLPQTDRQLWNRHASWWQHHATGMDSAFAQVRAEERARVIEEACKHLMNMGVMGDHGNDPLRVVLHDALHTEASREVK